MKIIAGLGNPGKKYEATRHNLGFMVVDLLAEKLNIPFTEKKKHQALVGIGTSQHEKLVLVKPQTFMNNSGFSIRSLLDYYACSLEDLVVIVDDLTLDPGVIRIRAKGSDGGQKGVASIIEHFGSQDFIRIKMGIGQPTYGEAVRHVLSGFSDEEWSVIRPAISRAAEAALAIIHQGIYQAMNDYNG